MFSKESTPLRIAVSRTTLGKVSDFMAAHRLGQINCQLGTKLAVEVTPHRLTTAEGLRRIFGKIEIVGIHGPLQAYSGILWKEFWRNATQPPRDFKEALSDLIWLVGFGGLKEPRFLKRFGTHLELTKALGAYLVMHHEPLLSLKDELKNWSDQVRILIENGWGPDVRPNPLSWNLDVMREYADQNRLGTCLDVSHWGRAARAMKERGIRPPSLLEAWEILKPEAVHLSDMMFDPVSAKPLEHLVPGDGDHGEELKVLISEFFKRGYGFLVIEAAPSPNAYTAIARTVEFIDRC